MSNKREFDIDPNTLFILTQKLDMFEKTGVLETLQTTQELKISVVKLEKDVDRIKSSIEKSEQSIKEKTWRIWFLLLGPLVLVILALAGHWMNTKNEIHRLQSEVSVLRSVINEKDKEYEYKYLKKDEFLQNLKEQRDESNSSSRR